MVTRCDSNALDLAEQTHPILKDYANQWGCDFIILDKKEDWMTDYELAHYRIFDVRNLLEKYERVLVIDSDIVIMPGTPNPFNAVPKEYIGSIYEDVGSRQVARREVIKLIQEVHGDVGWETGYINTGFFIVSQEHSNIFQKIGGNLWTGFGYDDALLGYNIHKFGHTVCELPYQWNHMSMFSEPWNKSASRFDSYIIHYAGAATFPDDQSGRGIVSSNAIDGRLALIKSDMERIANGLMDFKDAKPNEFQGVGSKLLTAKLGVQERDVCIKIPIDGFGVTKETRLYRELHTFNLNIPHTVHFMGMGEDKELGKFMILERLKQLPYPMSEYQLIDVATRSVIALRQLYKNKIPWICKLEHIMMDDKGNTKLVDFNDEPWDRPDIPFFHHGDGEAIIMYGTCNEDGIYQGSNKTPWSGWMACISHLALENNLNVEKIWTVALGNMWAYEYQNLKNVHQPISIREYSYLLRTETEKPDPNYGKLVPANRQCVDRLKMIEENLPRKIEDSDTWLDIGSNVGWFCHALEGYFRTVGLEADKDMVTFAEMQGEYLGSRARFMHKELTLESALDLPTFDVISALSVIHWSLIKPPEGSSQTSIGEGKEYFLDLLKILCKKARKGFYLEFPPHCYGALGVRDTGELMNLVCDIGEFDSVVCIGISDARRPLLKCQR
jgi:hypothetical protein